MIQGLTAIIQEFIWLYEDPFGIEDFRFDIVTPMYSLLYITEHFFMKNFFKQISLM